MKALRVFVLAFWLTSQLAFAAPALAGGFGQDTFQPVSAAELLAVTGGICSTCDKDPPPGDDEPPPTKRGSPYWELTRSSSGSTTNPGGNLVWQHRNTTSQAQNLFASYSERNALSWSASGGVPGGIVEASLGRQFDTTVTTSITMYVPAWHQMKLYVAYPVTRMSHTFTRYQDYSDNSREAVGSGSASSSVIHTLTNTKENPL
jgi:hypothetical protein